MYEAIRRGRPDRVPVDIGLTPAVYETFKRETGMEDPAEFFGIEVRNVWLDPLKSKPDFSRYLADMPPGSVINSEYGAAEIPGNFYHFARRAFPMAGLTTVAELEDYPWPDCRSEYRYERVAESVKNLKARGYFVQAWVGHIFEVAWQLTGFEKFMEGLVAQPEFVAYILDRITEDNCIKARRFAEAGVDMVCIGDDVAMQDRMMMSPATWREWFKPRHAKVIRSARDVNPDVFVWYHSDGKVAPIIEDLIEIGLNVLNPVQPECMDVYEIKRRYGERLAFWGAIGTQTVLPFGSTEDVKRTVKEMIELFAPGFVIAPTHVVEPDVPWENLLAFKEAVEEYGKLN